MQHSRTIRRSLLLAASMLSACAAGEPSTAASDPGMRSSAAAAPAHRPAPRRSFSGVYGDFLDGRFAASESDSPHAAEFFLRALAADPTNTGIQQQAFVACLLTGAPEALKLARQLPDNPVAQLLLADQDARNGVWEAAEQRFRNLPHQGLTQLLQPLLVAWAQQGGGHTDAALATLRPYVDGPRFRGVYALHAALINDLANRSAEAGRLYRAATAEYGGTNLRLAQIVASWQARQGHKAEAEQTLRALADTSQELSIALPALIATIDAPNPPRQVARATDGIAEAYLALAAALRAQDSPDFSLLLLRLALGVRPDFTAARLLEADIHESGRHYNAATAALTPVGNDDPLIAVVRLHRAGLAERLNHTDEATHALESAAHDYPQSALPLAQLGDLLRAKDRYAEAAAAYDRAIARLHDAGPAAWPLYYSRGIAEDRAHQWAKAEQDFQHALELSPDQPYVLNYLGYSWADQGTHLIQARKMLERAAELRPNDGAIVDSLGWVLLRQGDTAGAVRALEHAVELQPEDASINGHLGDAYAAAGRAREARYQWRRALNFNPEPDDAAKLEAKLHDGTGAGGGKPADAATTAEHRPPPQSAPQPQAR
jgi:tetratricopeptide (TPR) repeat protein